MKTIAVVPIKLNSQRLPNKNIKPFTNGEPLCHYILSTLINVRRLDAIYVYCSDERIRQYLPTGVTFLRRAENLDRDSTPINEVLLSFAHDVPADVYLMTHATAPFISCSSIERGLDAVINRDFDSAFSVRRIQDFLWQNEHPLNYDLDNIPRTQDLTPIFEETSGFYVYRSEVINRMNRRIGRQPFMVEVSEVEAVDIDTPEDFWIADAIHQRLSSECRRVDSSTKAGTL